VTVVGRAANVFGEGICKEGFGPPSLLMALHRPRRLGIKLKIFLPVYALCVLVATATAQTTTIRAGKLIDAAAGEEGRKGKTPKDFLEHDANLG
jgi:hypothetical protein